MMAETLVVSGASKAERYASLLTQLDALLAGETDTIARQANVCAALKMGFDWLWVGFYRVAGDTLVLGPFQGPVACSRIPFGRGVCGTAWAENRTVLVPDVEAFAGHIACSTLSRSEIVVPLRDQLGAVAAVLDVDSATLNDFDEDDRRGLEAVVALLGKL